MQAKVAGRKLIMVFLDSAEKLSRLGDAERVKRWVESIPVETGKTIPVASSSIAPPINADTLVVTGRRCSIRLRCVYALMTLKSAAQFPLVWAASGSSQAVGWRRNGKPGYQLILVVINACSHAAHSKFQFFIVVGMTILAYF